MYKLKLSTKYKKFFFSLILYTPLFCDVIYAKEFCMSNECTSLTSDLKFKTSRSYSNNPSYIKFIDNIFDGLLANNLESNRETSQKELEVNITADQQEKYDDGILKAYGNVEVETSNSLLSADKLQYDEKTGMLKIEGNIRYKRGEQYLEAAKIVFNTIDNEGFILNAYGSLEMDTITADLDLNKETKILIKKEDLLNENKLKDVGLKQTSNISLGVKFADKNKDVNDNLMIKPSSYSLNTNFNAFASKWRFQSNKINIINDNWSSKKLILTNDPFNKPQTKINLYDFKSKKIKNEILLTSRWSDLALENKLIIPLGPRSVNTSGINDFTWGINYDKNDKDGLYLLRNFKTIKINNNENHTLKFQGQYFLQRNLQGKTKSFPSKGKLILDPKEEQDAKFLDNFGVVTTYQNKIYDYDLNFYSSLNSLDLERWKNAARIKSSITKNLYFEQNNKVLKNAFKKYNRDKNLEIEKSNDIQKLNKKSSVNEKINLSKGNDIYMHRIDFKLFGDYRDKTWLGSLGEVEITSAYGLGLEKYSSWVHNKVNKSSVLGFIYGDYLAGSYSNTFKSASHRRFQSYTSRTHSYSIWSPEKKTYIDESYKYIPKRINRGLFFNATLGLNLYKYSDNQEQAYVNISGGPQLILGKYKRNFLDYTELGIYPNYTFSRGSTPFSFDQIVDKKYIQLVLKQQLYGPIAIKFSSNLNLDEYSKDYKKITNSSVEIGWNRRSYNVELYYDIDPKVGGIRFNINGIGFKGSGRPFNKFNENL